MGVYTGNRVLQHTYMYMYYPPGYFECTRTTTHDNDNTYDTYERQDELIASGGVILYP